MNQNFDKFTEMTHKVTENLTKLTEMNMNFFNCMYTQTKNLADLCTKAKSPEDLTKANLDYAKECQESLKNYNKEALEFFQSCQSDFQESCQAATKAAKKAA